MKLGLFMMPFHDATRPVSDLYDEDIAKIVLADRLGMSEAWIGQHYTATVEPFASPLMIMSAALAQTTNITLATGVINLPCHNPAIVAAEIAQFDHMSRGRMIFGIGPGSLSSDFELFGNTEGWARLRKFLESIDFIQKIWAGEPPYDLEGEFYNVKLLESNAELGTGIMQKPYSQPTPPIATSLMSPFPGLGAIAGENGWIPVSANFIPAASVASHWVKYAEGAEKAGRVADPSIWRVARNIVVAPTDAEAQDLAFDPRGGIYTTYDYLWKALSAGGFGKALKSNPDLPDEDVTIEGLVDDLVVIGSPDTVVQKLEAFRETVGDFGTLILGLQDWGHRAGEERRSMELLATEVLPRL
jgi:alkanesulfonate monooxygenase SsuD/methylene tetrahydromethanopterin reductase-like flavin-dependent oxidoreductase (luciferase family)